MLRLTNTVLPMHPDRLYASVCSTQAAYASIKQESHQHRQWIDKLIDANDEADIIALLNPSGERQHQQHGIDSYLLQVYIHEAHQPPFSHLSDLVGSTTTLSFDTPSGLSYRHLFITAIRQLDHDGSFGYYRLLAQPINYRLHQHTHSQIDTEISVVAMVADRLSKLGMEVVDDSSNAEESTQRDSWTPARIIQWQLSDWAHICERLSRLGLTGYLRHRQTAEHTAPKLVISSAYPSNEDSISRHIGLLRFAQVLHDRVHAPILAISEQLVMQPTAITMQRFNSASVAHPTQSADIALDANSSGQKEDANVASRTLTLDSPAAFTPVTDTETIDDASIIANSHLSRLSSYYALAHATELRVADTFILTEHSALNQHYRATHIVHLARNSLAHVTGLTNSTRHHQRHESSLDSGSHLTQLRLITADIPWVGAFYSKQALPPMTGITEAQSDSDSRNHMTPTKNYLLDAPAQAINRLEAQAGSNYGSHFTHRVDDQTLMQSIGDGEHLINTGSLLSSSRPSLFATTDEQAIESGYRNTDNGLSEWVTDHRDEQAYSQINVATGQVSASVKIGVINSVENGNGGKVKREGISVTTNAQVNIKSGEALVLSTQPQTHTQVQEHNYQHHTPTLTQTSLGGQHLAERLTQLATGLSRTVNNHKAIKEQLESISEEQESKTHHTTPFTLIDSAADTSYVSDDTIIHRTMGEMISTTQAEMNSSSGDSHHQISSESLNIIADGQVSFTNAKENITLSAHTGKLAATAKQDVNIASSTKEVEVVATNKITLTASGASITLDGADITIAANEVIEKGGKHSRAKGGIDSSYLSRLPFDKLVEKEFFDEQVQFLNMAGLPIKNIDYQLLGKNLNIETKVDDDGKTVRADTDTKSEELKTKIIFKSIDGLKDL